MASMMFRAPQLVVLIVVASAISACSQKPEGKSVAFYQENETEAGKTLLRCAVTKEESEDCDNAKAGMDHFNRLRREAANREREQNIWDAQHHVRPTVDVSKLKPVR